MIQGVPHAVHDGIEQIFYNGFIELCFLSLDDELHFLVQIMGKIPYQSGKPAENLADRNHPDLHDAFLKFACDSAEVLRRGTEFRDGALH